MRPTRDQTFLKMAKDLAERRTCWRRAVGCLLVDENGDILSSGYNGVAAGQPHCNEVVLQPPLGELSTAPVCGMPHRCPGSDAPSGQNLDACQAIHAEQNAILRCKDYRAVYTAYCTASPCITCVKLLLGTSCKRIVFLELYPHPAARLLWEAAGRQWIHLLT